MGKSFSTWLDSDTVKAINRGIPEKWENSYQFLQIAAKEKLEREGLLGVGK